MALKFFVAAALVATALAGPEINTAEGNVNIRVARAKEFRATRDMEQTASLFAVKQDVDDLKDQMKDAGSAMEFNKLLTPYVGNSIGRIDDLVKSVAAAESKVDGVSASVSDKMAALAKDIKKDADDKIALVQSRIEKLVKDNEQLKKDMEAAQNKASDDLKKTVDGKLKAADETLKKGLETVKSKMSSKRSVWIGGTTHTYRRGWREFETNRVEIDSSAPAFEKQTGTRFRAKEAGLYRMTFEGIGHGGWCHNHGYWNVAGRKVVADAHWWNPGTWKTQHQEVMFYVKAGQQFWFRLYGCNYATHGASNGNPDAHNKIYIEYMGQPGDNCKGPHCKGI